MATEVEYRLNTREFVRVEVSSRGLTGAQLAQLPVSVAVVAAGATPLGPDWIAAQWEDPPGADRATARRLCLLDKQGKFDVYSRHTGNPEVPVKYAGSILVK